MLAHWRCPRCGAVLEKTDQQKVLSQAHEDGAGTVLAGSTGVAACPRCQGTVPLQALAEGRHDHRVEEEPAGKPNIVFAILGGAIGGAWLLGLPSYFFTSEENVRYIALAGAALGVAGSLYLYAQAK